jgi:hypothetical protein
MRLILLGVAGYQPSEVPPLGIFSWILGILEIPRVEILREVVFSGNPRRILGGPRKIVF